jgi:SAM-dependent methyltransferase
MTLDRRLLSTVGHDGMAFWNPVPEQVLEDFCSDLPLAADSRVLDVGCGRAELLIRLTEGHRCHSLGLDPNPLALELARAEAARRVPGAALELRESPFQPGLLTPASLDLAICLGATQAFDGFEGALWTLRELVKPGGHLLVGEGYWRREPEPAYLEVLGCGVGDLHSHLVNVRLAEEAGLEVLRAHETAEADWDAYEDRYEANILGWCEEHADDPAAGPLREHIERWAAASREWGRTTLGFGLYLLGRPA